MPETYYNLSVEDSLTRLKTPIAGRKGLNRYITTKNSFKPIFLLNQRKWGLVKQDF